MSTSFQSSSPIVIDSELPAQTANTYGNVLVSNGTSAEVAAGIATDKHDNVYIVGQTNSQGADGYDAFIVKYDYQGIIQ